MKNIQNEGRIEFCKEKCCPVVDFNLSKNEVVLGDAEGPEGITIWKLESFKDFVSAVKEGKFDHIVNN